MGSSFSLALRGPSTLTTSLSLTPMTRSAAGLYGRPALCPTVSFYFYSKPFIQTLYFVFLQHSSFPFTPRCPIPPVLPPVAFTSNSLMCNCICVASLLQWLGVGALQIVLIFFLPWFRVPRGLALKIDFSSFHTEEERDTLQLYEGAGRDKILMCMYSI